jgi:hypothetical protein
LESVPEGKVHAILLFVGVLAAYIGLGIALFAWGIWAVSIDDPKASQLLSSLLPALFWPLLPLVSKFSEKETVSVRSRRTSLRQRTSETEDASSKARRSNPFKTTREAKDCLAARIVEQAERDGHPLTEIERKILYFTETGWTLPDMKTASTEFDRDYDQDEYERKIGRLVGEILVRDAGRDEQAQQTWDMAVEKLSEGDHYLTLLIDAGEPDRKPTNFWIRVLAIALLGFAITALIRWFTQWAREH